MELHWKPCRICGEALAEPDEEACKACLAELESDYELEAQLRGDYNLDEAEEE